MVILGTEKRKPMSVEGTEGSEADPCTCGGWSVTNAASQSSGKIDY